MTPFIKTQYQTLFAYTWHIRSRLMSCAAQLSEDDYLEDPGYGRGSLHNLFFHMLRAEINWHRALEIRSQQPPPQAEDYPTLQALQMRSEEEHQTWQRLLEKLSVEEIEGNLNFTNRRGEQVTRPRWRILQHVLMHGMQHHAEAAQLLTAKGQSPGDIDFIFFE
jgi:uncharacterized damage-inducible protein DinB